MRDNSLFTIMKRALAILLLHVTVCLSIAAQHPLREQVALAVTSYGVLRLTVYPTKHWVSERRPDDTDYKSFPSGHTATAFMGAELVREEYGNLWGAGAYLVATGIGLQRVYAERHYAHDVLAGAAIGFVSARIGYWLLPVERRLFGWGKSSQSLTITPTYNAELHAPAICMRAQF